MYTFINLLALQKYKIKIYFELKIYFYWLINVNKKTTSQKIIYQIR